jgi:hypothetical protein
VSLAALLLDRIAASRPAPGAIDWLRAAAGELGAAPSAFVAAGRRIGRGPLAAGDPLPGPDDPVPADGWSVDDAARAILVLALEADERMVEQLYREGDSREKRAIVRALPLLPRAGRFVELALDAGRTNEGDLFAALACDNPFPARHYGEPAWNKLVMKAAFVGAPLDRMIGLDRRANRDLCRMALDYVDQQESAGRTHPAELRRLVDPFGTIDITDRAAREALRRGMT